VPSEKHGDASVGQPPKRGKASKQREEACARLQSACADENALKEHQECLHFINW
jgi:hypothetical protein